jgi:hypothetical protein
MRSFDWADISNGAIASSIVKWYLEDPLSLHITFYLAGDNAVDWVIGRELFSDVVTGGKSIAGIGDAIVKHVNTAKGAVLELALSSGSGSCRIRTDMGKFREFLESTYARVPVGQETVDWDTAIDKLLDLDKD